MVRSSESLDSLVEVARESNQNIFPVVDEHGTLEGELSIDDLRRAVVSKSEEQDGPATVSDLMKPVIGPLVPDDDLSRAAQLLAGRSADSVLVVESRGNPRILGLFTRRDLVVAYSHLTTLAREDSIRQGG
jgi:CBS domain-containing protein